MMPSQCQRKILFAQVARIQGTPERCTDGWKLRVRARLAEPGAPSLRELAARIGCDPSSLSVLLRLSTHKPPGPSTSVLAEPVADLLAVPLVAESSNDFAHAADMLADLQRLNPARVDHALALIADMLTAEQARAVSRAEMPRGGDDAPTTPGPRKRPRRAR